MLRESLERAQNRPPKRFGTLSCRCHKSTGRRCATALVSRFEQSPSVTGTVTRYLAVTIAAGEEQDCEARATLRELIRTVTIHLAAADVQPAIDVLDELSNPVEGDHFPTAIALGVEW